jgi:hypothetical protein
MKKLSLILLTLSILGVASTQAGTVYYNNYHGNYRGYYHGGHGCYGHGCGNGRYYAGGYYRGRYYNPGYYPAYYPFFGGFPVPFIPFVPLPGF